jgi:RNA ligase (TIGR02306 family)
MSTDYKVPYTAVLEVNVHPNAHSLELCTVYGFQVVVQKDKYKVGDRIVFIPIDSILPEKIEKKIFPEGSKITLKNSRVRQVKIRSFPSQGLVLDPQDVSDIVSLDRIDLETDLSEILGIKKYEPPVKELRVNMSAQKGRKALANPNFHKYNGLNNIKWFPNMFKEGDEVVIQEKAHGSNCRAGLLPYIPNTIWKKIKKFFGLAPAFEYCYGSNNVDISSSSTYTGWYGEDVYAAVLKKVDAFNKMKPNETIFGELCGPGIQKGYSYGFKEHQFVLFDVKVLQTDGTQKWLSPDEAENYAKDRGFIFVPILYKGPFNKELAYQLTKGKSELNDKSEKVREGIVIKSAKNYSIEGNKQALKWVSEDYLSDASNTDEH